METQTSQSNQKQTKSQPIDEAIQVRVRIVMMRARFRFLDGVYLAKKLKRSEKSISWALNGKRKNLLARISRHLDYIERKEAEKLAA